MRVGRNTFAAEKLAGDLALKPLDDLDELPVYGRGDRVRVKNLKGPWQEVTVTVHWLREIDTPEFRTFLARAAQSYLARTQAAPLNVDDLTPWKVLGKKWHLSRKGFPSGKRVRWDPEVLERLADALTGAVPQARIDWTGKQVVHVYQPNSQEPWATLQTKRRSGIDLALYGASGRFTLGKIAVLGRDREIIAVAGKPDQIRIRLDSEAQVRSPEFIGFLKEHSQVST